MHKFKVGDYVKIKPCVASHFSGKLGIVSEINGRSFYKVQFYNFPIFVYFDEQELELVDSSSNNPANAWGQSVAANSTYNLPQGNNTPDLELNFDPSDGPRTAQTLPVYGDCTCGVMSNHADYAHMHEVRCPRYIRPQTQEAE